MVDINGDFSLKLRALQAQKGQKSQNGIRLANIDPRMSMNGSIFAPFAGGGNRLIRPLRQIMPTIQRAHEMYPKVRKLPKMPKNRHQREVQA